MPVLTSACEEPVLVDFDFSLKKEVSLVSFRIDPVRKGRVVLVFTSYPTYRKIGKSSENRN